MLMHQGSELDFVYAMVFSALFIVQAVGHRVGDYLLQTHTMATKKSQWKSGLVPLVSHCLVYSLTVAAFSLIVAPLPIAGLIFVLTFCEHLVIDSRVPVIAFKNFFERKIGGNKDFDANDLPFFVIIEIDQTIHYLRILIISLVFANTMT